MRRGKDPSATLQAGGEGRGAVDTVQAGGEDRGAVDTVDAGGEGRGAVDAVQAGRWRSRWRQLVLLGRCLEVQSKFDTDV